MVSYMASPQFKITITHSAVDSDYTDFHNVNVTRNENGYDVGRAFLSDEASRKYDAYLSVGDVAKVYVKDRSQTAWTTLLSGVISMIRPVLDIRGGETTLIQMDGAGYGFGKTVCAQEYGTQSVNPTLDTITEILTDANNGIVPKWVNKVLASATDSGYDYTTTNVAAINDVIPFISFPYKTNDKALNDLCDLVTAVRLDTPGNAGAHWIVSTAGDLHVKLVDASQGTWYKYYGNSGAASTLTQGIDFKTYNFEKLQPEANYVIYYGNWRRPSNGDYWSENSSALWTVDAGLSLTNDAVTYKIGSYSLDIEFPAAGGGSGFYSYPAAMAAAWNLNVGTDRHIPSINFYALRTGAVAAWAVVLWTSAGNTYTANFQSSLTNANEWYHFSFPIGPYWNTRDDSKSFRWTVAGAPDWANINAIQFGWQAADTVHGNIDGLYLGDMPICRVAYNSTNITDNKLRTKIIVDNVGKDDTLIAGTATGLMAQMAHAELLRCQRSPIIGTIVTPMIADLLPGQLMHVHAKKKADGTFTINDDFRVTRVSHDITLPEPTTTIHMTDDDIDGLTRKRYEDLNTVTEHQFRPEFQDRQSSSIKTGELDIKVTRLLKDYA